MFSIFKKKQSNLGMTGITVGNKGVSIAHVSHREDNQPYLEVCAFHPCTEKSKIPSILNMLIKDHGLGNTPCVWVLQPYEYQLFLTEAPNVSEHEMNSAIRWRIKDLLDHPLEQTAIDLFLLPEFIKKKNMVYVTACSINEVNNIADMTNMCGLNLVAIDISEMASRNIIGLIQEEKNGIGFLTLENDRSHLILSKNNEIYMARLLELDLHRWLGKDLSVLDQDPSELALSEKRVIDDLILEIQRSMDYCTGELGVQAATDIIIAPFCSHHRHEFLSHFKENLIEKIDVLDLNNVIDAEYPIEKDIQPMCMLAVGGALRNAE